MGVHPRPFEVLPAEPDALQATSYACVWLSRRSPIRSDASSASLFFFCFSGAQLTFFEQPARSGFSLHAVSSRVCFGILLAIFAHQARYISERSYNQFLDLVFVSMCSRLWIGFAFTNEPLPFSYQSGP